MGLVMELIARHLAPQRTAWKIVGTVGLILVVQGLGTIKYGPDPISVPQYLPKGTETFRVLDVNIGYDQLIITIISLVAVAALYALFRFTRLGIAMRAVVDDPDLLDIQGTSPTRVRRISWIIGSTFAALSGVLIVPLIGLEPIALTFLVVLAFGAAAIGFFASIPLAYLGGIIIGIVADVSKKYVLDVDWLGGLPASLPFLILFVVLLVTPRRRLVSPSSTEARPALQWHGPAGLRYTVGAAVVVALALVPQFVDVKLSFWTNALTQIILFLALGLLVRTAGLVSLCATAFAAIGAVAFSQFAVDHNMPWLVALLLAALVAVPVGALIAIPAIRLSGLFLALATLGFGIMVERLFYPRNFMFTTFAEGRRIPRPSWGSSDEGYYYVVLAFVVIAAIVIALIHRGRLGRILRGLGDSPLAVSTLGLSTNMTRVIVFCIAAFFAAIAGILYGGLVNFATASDRYYQSFTSLILLAVLALAPFRRAVVRRVRRIDRGDPRLSHRRRHHLLAERDLRPVRHPGGTPGRSGGHAAPTAGLLRPFRETTTTDARAGSRDHGWDRRCRVAAPSRAGRRQRDRRARGRSAHRPLRWSPGGRQPQLPCADGPDHRADRAERRRARRRRSTPAAG